MRSESESVRTQLLLSVTLPPSRLSGPGEGMRWKRWAQSFELPLRRAGIGCGALAPNPRGRLWGLRFSRPTGFTVGAPGGGFAGAWCQPTSSALHELAGLAAVPCHMRFSI
jgi:hypothetical protein